MADLGQYEPGWKWSEHVGAATGERWCEVEHVGLVLSGRAMAAMRDGTERVMEPGSSSPGQRLESERSRLLPIAWSSTLAEATARALPR